MDIKDVLTRGVEKILPDKEGLAKLMNERKIKIYQGFDPSMPSLHLGNLVGLIKLRQFQRLGHEVIFLIGDFTGMIGDPDKSSSRPRLTRKKVLENSKSWKKQAGRVLNFEGQNPAKIMFNSEWNDKLSFLDVIDLASKTTYAQIVERDMFQKRINEGKDIWLHEFLYPLVQGYDSVALDVDLEIGGSDQLFNMMMGRRLMKAIKDKEKYVLTTKLLVDKEGNKVGKTTGNALFMNSTPENFYAGIMSFPDEAIELGFEVLTEVPLDGVTQRIKQNPMDEKKKLAFEVVKLLWGNKNANKAQQYFEQTFQEHSPEFNIKIISGQSLTKTIVPFTNRQSITAAKELIRQGSVDLNGKKITDGNIKVRPNDKIKVGEHTFLIAKASDIAK